MIETLQESMRRLFVMLTFDWTATSVNANDFSGFIYPADIVIGGQTFEELLPIHITRNFLWSSYPDAVNHPHVHFAERRAGRSFIRETVRADRLIIVPFGHTVHHQLTTENPCLDNDYDFLGGVVAACLCTQRPETEARFSFGYSTSAPSITLVIQRCSP